MYYAEKVINGILHYRTLPDMDWIPMTQQQLTDKIMKLRQELEKLIK